MSDASSPAPGADDPAAGSRRFLSAVDRVLYPITLGYTVVILGFTFFEFSKGGAFVPRFPFADVYLALLTAYAAQREGSKWLGADEAAMRIRRGELFVGIWFAVYLLMVSMANLSARWVLPLELKTITLGVLGIFAVTGLSSGVRERMRPTTGGAPGDDARSRLVLEALQKGPMSAEQVGRVLGVSKATAWRALEALVKAGRIRQIDSADSRERKYSL